MRIKRSAASIAATVLASGYLAAAATAVTPDRFHDMSTHASTTNITVDSVSTSDATPDRFHDM